jgi:hypothetical protein
MFNKCNFKIWNCTQKMVFKKIMGQNLDNMKYVEGFYLCYTYLKNYIILDEVIGFVSYFQTGNVGLISSHVINIINVHTWVLK